MLTFLFLLENIVAEDFFYIFVPEETNRVLDHSYSWKKIEY